MAEIRGFKGIRFTAKAGDISEITCPPYDIISEEQRLQYLRRNGNNIIRLELPKDGENPYAEAGRTLQNWLQGGVLKQDDSDSLYVYEEEFTAGGKRLKINGIICRVKIEEFSKGVVLPHEETLSKAKADRFNLMDATLCNFSQIYSLYNDENADTQKIIDSVREGEPVNEFTDSDGVTHRLWIISDAGTINLISSQFAPRKLYIADGHHRYETSLNFRNSLRERGIAKEGDGSDYVMMMLVDMANPGLVVFPTHRFVRDLEDFSADDVIEGSREYFDITHIEGTDGIEEKLTALYDEGKHAFGFYCGADSWELMVLRDVGVLEKLAPGKSSDLRELDVSILHDLVLEKIMGIDRENMANQINLTYTRVLSEAVDEVKSGKFQCSFILNPTRVSEISHVAANGEKMPQKSTYFYPKLITGLVMNKLL